MNLSPNPRLAAFFSYVTDEPALIITDLNYDGDDDGVEVSIESLFLDPEGEDAERVARLKAMLVEMMRS